MKFNFEFSNISGSIYSQGNLLFTNDGSSVISPAGNRVSIIDIIRNESRTLNFQNRKNINCIALSPDGRFLISADINGHAILVGFAKKVVISHFNFKKKVTAMKFSPDSKKLAVNHGKEIRIWDAPVFDLSFFPFKLSKSFFGHRSKVNALCWSRDSKFFASASSDASVRIYNVEKEGIVSLTGHRGGATGCFFDREDNFYTITKSGAIFSWKTERTDSQKSPMSVSLKEKHYLNLNRTKVKCAAFRQLRSSVLIAIGLSDGVFQLHELPGFQQLHSLSITHRSIDSIAINNTGDWLVFGSKGLGQLLVWEWQSESVVLKQQGHNSEVNSLSYSSDGRLFATAGDDGKVKLWNSSSGFCFITFSDHTAPATKVCFSPKGAFVLSCSLDGTVRAFDLVKYKNFRTFTTENSAEQFTCVTVDSMGKIVCAGTVEGRIYVWALQTGKQIDSLSGHEGPISDVMFAPNSTQLASSSWDGKAKIWNLTDIKGGVETFEMNSDALALCYRPDGKQLCVSTVNGKLFFWDVVNGKLEHVIDGSKDILGGRRKDEFRTAKNSTIGRCFTSLDYSPDGTCVIAGGESKFVCIYEISQKILVKKFQISQNRSLDGVLNFLNSKNMTKFGPVNSDCDSSESDDLERYKPDRSLPGVRRGDLAKRKIRLAVRTKSVKFSPTGRQWACACTEGVLIYELKSHKAFDPFELHEGLTPVKVRETLKAKNYSLAVLMAVKLSMYDPFFETIESVPPAEIPLVFNSVPEKYLPKFFELFAWVTERSSKIHLISIWLSHGLKHNRHFVKQNRQILRSSLRTIYKNLNSKILLASDLISLNNAYLRTLTATSKEKCLVEEDRVDQELRSLQLATRQPFDYIAQPEAAK